MKKVYYKVITKYDRASCTIVGRHEVDYPVKEWAKPNLKGSKLLVFATKKDAKAFFGGCSAIYKIVRCNIKNPIITRNLHILPVDDFEEFANSFWYKFNRGEVMDNVHNIDDVWYVHAPSGTVLCDEVYCLE